MNGFDDEHGGVEYFEGLRLDDKSGVGHFDGVVTGYLIVGDDDCLLLEIWLVYGL